MSKIKSLAVVATGVAVAATAAAPALASNSHSTAPKSTFKSVASPNKNVKKGQVITAKGTGAKKNTAYSCALIVLGPHFNDAPDYNTVTGTQSNAKGKISCSIKFVPFSAPDVNGKTRHCPPTKADKKAGFECSFAFGDVATTGKTSASFAKFTAK